MVYGIDEQYPLERKDILVFIIGLFSFVKVRVMGTFGISEILCFGLYLVVANPLLWMKHKGVTNFFLMTMLWLIGVFISDRYNDSNLTNSLKGLFNVVFLLGLIPFVYWALYDKPSRMIYFWIGNAISSLISFYFKQSIDLDEFSFDVWRVYAWYYPFIVLSGILYYKGKTLLSCVVIEAFGFWSLFHMSRNVFLTVTLSVCVILFLNSIINKDVSIDERIRLFKRKTLPLLFVLGIGCLGISYTYEYLASNKILGERAYQKYYMQKNSELGLTSGRSDFFRSLYLAKNKPLFGYGSYARNNEGMLESYYIEHNLEYDSFKLKDSMMPGHSYLMGGWVYAGILGLIFWLYVLKLIGKYLLNGLLRDNKLIGINVLLTFTTLWNIFFSPFANRLNFLFYIIMVVLTINARNSDEQVNDQNIDYNPIV